MLEERYAIEAERILKLELEAEADLEHPVFGDGKPDRPLIMFIGEAPGKDEAASGRPFVGKAGKQLDGMLRLAGIDRTKVFVTNSVKYRPTKLYEHRVSNRTPSVTEIKDGLELLKYEIETVRPTVIATLGNVPLSAVQALSDIKGEKLNVGMAHGMPTVANIGGRLIHLFPLYHPAASIYNRELKPVLEQDLIRLGDFARSL
ncbi:MAG: uracil-DNA glycosylase [Clostridiales bacterium]|nr:uracil-DNA glycosylase [Clostridiales bacterium]